MDIIKDSVTIMIAQGVFSHFDKKSAAFSNASVTYLSKNNNKRQIAIAIM
jgi:hypothetical protein